RHKHWLLPPSFARKVRVIGDLELACSFGRMATRLVPLVRDVLKRKWRCARAKFSKPVSQQSLVLTRADVLVAQVGSTSSSNVSRKTSFVILLTILPRGAVVSSSRRLGIKMPAFELFELRPITIKSLSLSRKFIRR